MQTKPFLSKLGKYKIYPNQCRFPWHRQKGTKRALQETLPMFAEFTTTTTPTTLVL
jgi:hypothetical protein